MMNIRVHACTLCSMGGGREGFLPACMWTCMQAWAGCGKETLASDHEEMLQ